MSKICGKLNIKYIECPKKRILVKPTLSKKITPLTPSSLNKTQIPSRLSCVNRSALKLQPQQLRIIEYMKTHRGILIYHSVGSGKTLTAITLSQCFLDQYPNKKVIVVCPASLVENFKKQMTYYKNIQYENNYRFYSIQGFVNAKKRKEIDCKDSMLIIDEAHNLKTSTSKIKNSKTGKIIEKGINSKHLIQCAEKSDKVVLMSATPMINDVKDLIPLYNMIRDLNEPKMVISTKNNNHSLYSVLYTKDRLLNLMRCKVSFFNAIDKNLFPESLEHEIFLQMTPSYQDKYDTLVNEKGLSTLAISHFGQVNIKSFYNGFRRAVNNLEGSNSPKVKWVVNKILTASENSKEKIIVFSHFLDAGNLAIIKALPKNIQEKCAYIKGNVSRKKRSEIVNKYNENHIQFLFISKAGGEGLDLKGTRQIIILEPSWNRSMEEQVIGRGIRYLSHSHLPLNERKVDIYRLYTIKKTDIKFQQIIQNENPNDTPPKFDPISNSVDMLMRYLQYHKEKKLIFFREQLINNSIENQICL